jgi:hypothetical protein
MKSKLVVESAGQRTCVLILDPGDEAFAAMKGSARNGRALAMNGDGTRI